MKKYLKTAAMFLLCLAIILATYAVVFKLLFGSSRIIKQLKNIAAISFDRDLSADKFDISPFGNIKIKTLAVSAKGGFDFGVPFLLNSLEMKTDFFKLFKRDLVIKSITVDGITLDFNYRHGRQFNDYALVANSKAVVIKAAGLIKKVDVNSIQIKNGTVNLKTDFGDVKFKNIITTSSFSFAANTVEAVASFDFEIQGLSYAASADLSFDKSSSVLYLKNVVSKELSFSADGKIIFNDDGTANVEYVAKINKTKFSRLLKEVLGFAAVPQISNNDSLDDILISYPSPKEKN
jgi:hypothetical protein